MTGPAAVRLDVDALYARLCERLAELRPKPVAAVLEAFLEVSTLPGEQRLWSLEFAFDEDDGRIARLEARFADHGTTRPDVDTLHGYEVQMVLPRVLPPRPAGRGDESEAATAGGGGGDALLARFERAMADLGAYRTIEAIELVSAEVYLL